MPRFWVATPGGIPRSEVGSAPGQIPRYDPDGRLPGSVTDHAYLTEQGLAGATTDQYRLYRQLLYQGTLDGRDVSGLRALMLDVFGDLQLIDEEQTTALVDTSKKLVTLTVTNLPDQASTGTGTTRQMTHEWVGWRIPGKAHGWQLRQVHVDAYSVWGQGSNTVGVLVCLNTGAGPDLDNPLYVSHRQLNWDSPGTTFVFPEVVAIPASVDACIVLQRSQPNVHFRTPADRGDLWPITSDRPVSGADLSYVPRCTVSGRYTPAGGRMANKARVLSFAPVGARLYVTAQLLGGGTITPQVTTNGGATWHNGTLAGSSPDPKLADYTEYAYDFTFTTGQDVQLRIDLNAPTGAELVRVAAYGLLLK